MQGFEMVHRGVIPEKSEGGTALSLERLMVALDIMPAWRDPLTAISYNPFTRVDVRRMHKIKVLEDADLVRAYMDLGYNAEKADKMAEFTIAYNANPAAGDETAEDVERAKQKDLTKADVLSGYMDGLLDGGVAGEILYRLGYSAAEAEYYLARVDYQRDSDERTFTTSNLHSGYVKGVFSHAEVTDELGKLNLPATMSDAFLKMWDMEKAARINKPTKSELVSFLRKKIIDDETWHTEMLGLGYPEKYIAWYAQAV
ncbi:hypothetical protein ES708_34485 [subsurface metagenome]